MAALAAFEQATTARERMIERHLPLADGLARRYRHTSEPLDDLMQVARIGLMKAVDRWDPDRGYSFSTFAVPTITGELQRHFRDRTWAIRPPRDVQELYMRVQLTRAQLSTELGREPTARDVADAIGCDAEDVVEALAAGDAYALRSLDAPLQTDEANGVTGADLLADDGREIERAEDAAALWQLGQPGMDDIGHRVPEEFEAVTRPKLQRWLVQTVGRLVTVVGAALLGGARAAEGSCPRGTRRRRQRLVACGSRS